MPRLVLMPLDKTVEVEAGTSVFEAARGVGIQVDTACGGMGTCGLCRVRIIEGFDALSPLGPIDKKLLGDLYAITRERLACQARLSGDCVVDIPPPRPSKLERKRAALERALERRPDEHGRQPGHRPDERARMAGQRPDERDRRPHEHRAGGPGTPAGQRHPRYARR